MQPEDGSPMRDTKLIFVEGLPGLGKTTTASWLTARLRASFDPRGLFGGMS